MSNNVIRRYIDGFKVDIEDGSWKKRKYQTNNQETKPSYNWLILSELKLLMPKLAT